MVLVMDIGDIKIWALQLSSEFVKENLTQTQTQTQTWEEVVQLCALAEFTQMNYWVTH